MKAKNKTYTIELTRAEIASILSNMFSDDGYLEDIAYPTVEKLERLLAPCDCTWFYDHATSSYCECIQ